MSWLKNILDIIYPRTCEACESPLLSEEKIICLKCLVNLPIINNEESIEELQRKFWGKVKIQDTFTFLRFTKNGKVQKLLHALKYRNRPDIGIYLGKLFGLYLKNININDKIDILIGVPIHQTKEQQRGYNQADLIAEGIAEVTGIRFEKRFVIKIKSTESQTKKNRYERFKNVEATFEVINKDEILGKRIGIVDDVLTTGSTIESLASTLLEAGALEILILTIASV